MTYILTFIAVLVLAYFYDHAPTTRHKEILSVVIIIMLTLIGGLRSVEVGTDNYRYKDIFETCRASSLLECLRYGYTSTKEAGFIVFTWLIARFGESYTLFTTTTSFFTIVFVIAGMRHFADSYKLSLRIMLEVYLFVYYCCYFNLVRQGLACAIVFYAFKYIDEKKIIKYLVFVILAASIQTSLLAAIPIYFLLRFTNNQTEMDQRKNKELPIIAMFVLAPLFIFVGPIITSSFINIISRIPLLANLVPKLSSLSSVYSTANRVSYGTGIFIRAIPQVMIVSIFYNKIRNAYKNMVGLYLIEWIQVFIMLLGTIYEPMTRVAYIYNYAQLILFAAIGTKYRGKDMKIVVEIIILLYCVTYWILFTVLNHYGYARPVFPYEFAIY